MRAFVTDDGARALAVFADFSGQPGASTASHQSMTAGLKKCAPDTGEHTYGEGVVAHAFVEDRSDPQDVWSALQGDRAALLMIAPVPTPAPAGVVVALDRALLSGLQDGSAFSPSGSGADLEYYGGGDSYTLPELSLAQLQSATGTCSTDWETEEATAETPDSVPCVSRKWTDSSTWGVGSSVGDRGVIHYAGSSVAGTTRDITSLLDDLESCESTRWTVHRDAAARGEGAWGAGTWGAGEKGPTTAQHCSWRGKMSWSRT